MLTLKNPAEAERFVNRQSRLGNDVHWDNYDIVFFRADDRGVWNKDGAFKNGKWGFENRVPVNEEGTWEIDYRNVRRANRTRN